MWVGTEPKTQDTDTTMISTICPKFKQLLAIFLIAACMPFAHAQPGFHEPFEVTGSVIKNHDGDTIRLDAADSGVIVVRLSGADAPESGQAYWKAARSYLREFVTGKPVTIWCYKRDRYDREVCHVSVDGVDVGLALIQQGYAWYAFQFASELTPTMRQTYPAAEEQAIQAHAGIWADDEPQTPWECRKLKKARKKCR